MIRIEDLRRMGGETHQAAQGGAHTGAEAPTKTEVHTGVKIEAPEVEKACARHIGMIGETCARRTGMIGETCARRTGMIGEMRAHHIGMIGHATQSDLAVRAKVKMSAMKMMMNSMQFVTMEADDCQDIRHSCRFLSLLM
jgi:hypothetical protein